MQYYNFTIDGRPVGYFVIEDGSALLQMTAHIAIAGKREENTFAIRFDGDRPVEVQVGDGAWQPIPEGTYPTSAYAAVLRSGLPEYRAYVEGSGRVETRRIVKEGDLFVEYVEDDVCRKFQLHGDDVVYICWGGTAESRRVPSMADAVRGTVYEK